MKKKRVVIGLCFTTVFLATAWLTFSSYMILDTLFPSNQVLFKASDGAEIRIDGNRLKVLSGSAGMIVFHQPLIPAMAFPFAIIVVFALIGCGSIIQWRVVQVADNRGRGAGKG